MSVDIYCQGNAVYPLFVGWENCKSNYAYGPAVRTYYLLHYIVSGRGEYRADGKSFTLTEGQAFLIKPNEMTFYRADKTEPWSYIWMAWESPLDIFKSLPLKLESRELKAIMSNYPTAESVDKLSSCRATALLWSVTACLAEPDFVQNETYDYITRAISVINLHYSDRLTVSGIADRLNIDRSYFSNLFKKEIGIPPQQYITELRMQKALDLLKKNLYSVAVVAASVGFSDQFTFSRCFKKYYGVSPTHYKELM